MPFEMPSTGLRRETTFRKVRICGSAILLILHSRYGVAFAAEKYIIAPVNANYTTFASLVERRRLQPDDIVEFQASSAGGTASFFETLTPNGSGTPGHMIVIRAREGDNITIDGGQKRANTIYMYRRSGIVFKGLKFANAIGGNLSGSITLNACEDVTIEKCEIRISLSGDGLASRRGIVTENHCNRLSITKNKIYTDDDAWGPGETDCIFVSGDNIRIDGNSVTMHNSYARSPSGHNDCIQTLDCANLSVESNVCDRNVLADPTQGQGIYCEWYNHDDDVISDYGKATIRNNIVFGNGGSFLLQTMVRPAKGLQKDPAVSISIEDNLSDAYNHRTSVPFRSAHGGVFVRGSMTVMNNIFIIRRTNPPFLCMEIDVPYLRAEFASDYNHFYPEAATREEAIISSERRFMTLSRWQANGRDTHSIGFQTHWKDPQFIDQMTHDYHLRESSPDIRKGGNLSCEFLSDRDNNLRPRSGAWDIGPYCFTGAGYDSAIRYKNY